MCKEDTNWSPIPRINNFAVRKLSTTEYKTPTYLLRDSEVIKSTSVLNTSLLPIE